MNLFSRVVRCRDLPLLISSFRKLSSSSALPQASSLNPVNPLTQPELKTLVLKQYAKNGKFSGLVHNVIALPAVLLTACQNLTTPQTRSGHESRTSPFELVSEHFSVHEMGRELFLNRFDIEAGCVPMVPFEVKGETLVLPNLKLKVLIEAIRMVFEVIYDERFVTFAYGGRAGMGRHTAVRYLKGSVENPSWWFAVKFNPQKFYSLHVNRLCKFIEEKIDDRALIDLLRRLFASGGLSIELGGCNIGRGFPQESGLCSILLNIYFNGFDKEIQNLRLQVSRDNPKIGSDEVVRTSSNMFYKPMKIYAVRYLDEILIITSGSKVSTMDLMKNVLRYLEGNLELKVERTKTAIHSAVSEKISFLGMELQAVPPSVLNPPMSEKAIRARKKYLRQKEVKAIELKNARERNRKKLGLKIMSHVFKKLKRGAQFKFDFHIVDEVGEIFRTWADEVVQEFLGSLDDRYNWHRMLSSGNFLSLQHIRDQLPRELVDAYDDFREQVDKHLTPIPAMKALKEKERRETEEYEQKYAERTVSDLTRLCIKVNAPIELVRKAVKMVGFTNNMGRPQPIHLLFALEDADIVKWYAGVGRRWLEFFCCCHNFKMVKTIVTYHLRFSCILTLAEKHESTKRDAMKHYSKDLKVSDTDETEVTYFPTEKEVKMMGDRNLSDPKPVDGALTLALIRLACEVDSSHSCAAHFCGRADTILYRVRLLQNRLNVNPSNEEKWVPGLGAIHESVNRKCLPLCPLHRDDLFLGEITLQDVDLTSCVDVD
ncbi:nuclear intron maturase 3, mitochondrial [Punica granatum]|uniref:Nuclear intron maturase 3, mitochondrial n=2 Tax=Punica granatum TaxID=22663 RepID=A0A6P8CHZ4_PUNGR|nr:nuclear intron maturase 3, mitochondrial [Punica granatum]XP_031382026.1 nuclear intron maturase 3, mitochondrial [Punica granatum]XP_031382027.1 nuclear intron maturase 3, mitochondrial [Punica granatum]XP_031382028.1 nuclear intron maturase 3, mitochondrial [Punica granatum]XP_031382029.1 nuclear intron maturase 3, mitochondrial [Punica granatum]XP_031382030.1 nuclear intron maturase 3, mitochondrial [Punica granatum]OWM78915.1 hypothetical protein CDL15_Pgr003086 [Punica granatum]PKI32